MAEFDFAPRPPKQGDETDEQSPFGPAPSSQKQTANADSTSGQRGGINGKATGRGATRKNPSETAGIMSGLISLATTMGMARHTNAHIEPMGSPSGLLNLVRTAFGSKHVAADDHSYNLDVTRQSSAGGGISGMATGMGMVGGPLLAAAKRDATGAAMKAIGGMSRGTGGGLSSTLGTVGSQAQHHMQWLGKGVKHLYKLDR